MTTFSDGGDVAAMADYDSQGNMRLHLQALLDNKEKQLQSAATLGHQLLAQRMELEERIRQMQELELDGSGSDDGLDGSVRDKYRDLADAIKAWDTENEQLTSVFGAKVSGNLACLFSLRPISACIADKRCSCSLLASCGALQERAGKVQRHRGWPICRAIFASRQECCSPC